jgi:hypothetical protein
LIICSIGAGLTFWVALWLSLSAQSWDVGVSEPRHPGRNDVANWLFLSLLLWLAVIGVLIVVDGIRLRRARTDP